MMATLAELALSASYRNAQRTLALWLERSRAGARRGIFAARASLAGLDAVERHRMARWLAWLCVASAPRENRLLMRIRQLDPALGDATAVALAQLPHDRMTANGRAQLQWNIPSRAVT